MVDQARSTYRARIRDPGVVLWVVAALCWAGLLVPLLVSGVGHDHLLGHSTSPLLVALLVFAGAWLVMVGAMMLPTTVPMVRMFQVVSAGQDRPWVARAAFLVGYLAVWMAFALVAVAAASGLQLLVTQSSWLQARPQLVLAAALAIAGAFQFSPLKDRCLTQCRDPKAFLFQHYRRGIGGGWALGLRHGMSCLGCCWALMLIMFATGVGNLLAMVALTAVMIAEKTTAWGQRLMAPVGVALLVVAAAMALGGLGIWEPQAPLPAHEHVHAAGNPRQ